MNRVCSDPAPYRAIRIFYAAHLISMVQCRTNAGYFKETYTRTEASFHHRSVMPASVVFCIRTTFFLTTDNRVLRTQPRTAIWSVEILPLGNVLRMPTGIQLKEHALLSHLY